MTSSTRAAILGHLACMIGTSAPLDREHVAAIKAIVELEPEDGGGESQWDRDFRAAVQGEVSESSDWTPEGVTSHGARIADAMAAVRAKRSAKP